MLGPVPLAILAAAVSVGFALTPGAGFVYENNWHIAIRFVAFFYSGVALYVYRRHVPLTPAVLAGATALFGLTWWLAGEPVLTQFKNQPMLGFQGEFVANVLLPDGVGLGKSVARGFGAVQRVD